jgi:hypothetical protein
MSSPAANAKLPRARVALARCLRRLYRGTNAGAVMTPQAADGRNYRKDSDHSSSSSSSSSNSSRAFPAIKHLRLLDMQLHDACVYAAINWRDVAADRTCIIPLRSIRARVE